MGRQSKWELKKKAENYEPRKIFSVKDTQQRDAPIFFEMPLTNDSHEDILT